MNLFDWAHDVELLKAVFSIVIIDLVLSGDNAVVIGMASRRLPPRQQRRAMLFGAGGAIALRVLFTTLAALLLSIPLLEAVGGLVLIWIAFNLAREGHSQQRVDVGATLFEAIRTIILADVVMSLDNILAVGGAAHGDLPLLIFGLMLSMPIILFGSSLVATLMNRFAWLIYAGSGVLAYTAAEMILDDGLVAPHLPHADWFTWAFTLLIVGATLGAAYAVNRQARRAGGDTPIGGEASQAVAEPAAEPVGGAPRR